MIVEERQERLLAVIQKHQFISLQELKGVTQTSISTIRRDLASLTDKGLVKRVHGVLNLLLRIKNHRQLVNADRFIKLINKKLRNERCSSCKVARQFF